MDQLSSTADRHVAQLVYSLEIYLDRLPFPAFLCGSDQKIVSINRSMYSLLGLNITGEQNLTNLYQLESILATSLDPVRILNEAEPIKRIRFSNLSGEIRYCSLSVLPMGEERGGHALYILQEETRLFHLEDKLARKNSELAIFSQVVSALGSSLNFEEILQIILIAVTAREGLGFNRAFLFTYNENKRLLEGHLAIGPSSPEEAGRIWSSLPDEGKPLIEVLKMYKGTFSRSENSLSSMVRTINIPLDENPHSFARIVDGRHGMIVDSSRCECGENCRVCNILGATKYAAVPMVAGEKVLGVITADNYITFRDITEGYLTQLQVFADHAAVAIERSRLYQSLADYLQELEKANTNLRNAQDELLKIERVSLWSELTSDIAHELRNPASIVGGFAALILKSQNLPDNLREQAGIICAECSRMENALKSLLDFSKSFSQEKSFFSLYEIIREVIDIIKTKHPGDTFEMPAHQCRGRELIEGRVDQIKYAFYTILSIIAEHVAGRHIINIDFQCADNIIKATFEPAQPSQDGKDLLGEIANPKFGRMALKTSLAFEAIKYNGGSLGIESDKQSRSRLYVEWPQARS